MKTKQNLRRPLILVLAVVSACLASCASGPSYSEVSSTLPPIAEGHGRVFVYRPSSLGAAVKPSVKIDNQVVGTSEARGFLYSDQKPGTHEISISTEWKHKAPFTVEEGRKSFVRCKMMMGVFVGHVMPRQVDAMRGESEIQNCKLQAGVTGSGGQIQ